MCATDNYRRTICRGLFCERDRHESTDARPPSAFPRSYWGVYVSTVSNLIDNLFWAPTSELLRRTSLPWPFDWRDGSSKFAAVPTIPVEVSEFFTECATESAARECREMKNCSSNEIIRFVRDAPREDNESPSGRSLPCLPSFGHDKNVISRADCSFVLRIRIQKWIQSPPAYFPVDARIRGPPRHPRLCLFPRDTSRRDNGSFPFLRRRRRNREWKSVR